MFSAQGPSLIIIIINGTVHLVMYMYYFMSAYSPSKTLTRMKKFLTQIQLVSHTLIFFFVVVSITPAALSCVLPFLSQHFCRHSFQFLLV